MIVTKKRLTSLKKRIGKQLYRIEKVLSRDPFVSFLVFLGILFALIFAGNKLGAAKDEAAVSESTPKAVTVVSIGNAPKVPVSAQVVKDAVVTISAQAPGIVTSHLTEGTRVKRGTRVVTLSSSYTGGSAQSLGASSAQKNYEFVNGTFSASREIIEKRRDLAQKADTQADNMKSIANESLSGTRELLYLNEDILNSVNTNLAALEASNVGGANDAAILQAKQAKAGVLSGISSIRAALKSAEYQAGDNAPSQMSDVSRDIALKGLEIEQKSLELNLELSKINAQIAGLAAAMMAPVSPCTGVVERTYVKKGESVNPGMPLVGVLCDTGSVKVVAQVSAGVAKNASVLEKSVIHTEDGTVSMLPTYVSKAPTDNGLFAVTFSISKEDSDKFTDGSYVEVEIPLAHTQVGSTVPYIPLDAVYQTQEKAYVFLAKEGDDGYTAHGTTITLGTVYGDFVEVTEGLTLGDQVIVDRSVLEGNRVSPQ